MNATFSLRLRCLRWAITVIAIFAIVLPILATTTSASAESSTVSQSVTRATTSTGTGPFVRFAATAPVTCEDVSPGAGWAMCAGVKGLDTLINFLDSGIQSLMTIDKKQYDNPKVKGAWQVVRNLALSLLVPVMLLMVIGTAIGAGPFDAYTVKKSLPRMLAATLFILISYPLTTFLVELSNLAGSGVLGIITTAFGGPAGEPVTLQNLFSPPEGGVLMLIATGGTIGAISFAALTAPVALSLGLALAGGLIIGFFLLVMRQVIVLMLIITAPIAIIPWIFPGNDKLWKLWRETLEKALLFFVIFMAVIGVGRGFALIADLGNFWKFGFIVQMAAYIVPYYLFKQIAGGAGAAMAAITGATNNRAKGFFDRNRNFRDQNRKKVREDALQGKNYRGRSVVGSAMRRAKFADQGGFNVNPFSGKRRAQYRASQQKYMGEVAHKMIEEDHGRAAGDDLATTIAQQGDITVGRFQERYSKSLLAANQATRTKMALDGKSAAEIDREAPLLTEAQANLSARQALGTIESSFGAKMGTDAMKVASFKARLASNTGYNDDNNDMYQQITEDSARMVSSGLMSAADATAAVKQNKMRADISGVGWGAWQGQIGQAAARYAQGGRGRTLIRGDEEFALRKSALTGSEAANIVAGRPETVKTLAGDMVHLLNDSIMTGDSNLIDDQLAAIAGRYDAMAQTSPEKARVMADKVLGEEILLPGSSQPITVRQAIENARNRGADPLTGKQRFLELRREYTNAGLAAAAGATATTPPGP